MKREVTSQKQQIEFLGILRIGHFFVIKTNSLVSNLWEICPTQGKLRYNEYRLKSSITLKTIETPVYRKLRLLPLINLECHLSTDYQ